MTGARKKVYVGCGLTKAPPEFLELISRFKERLRGTYEVIDFFGSKEIVQAHPELGGQGAVYRQDIEDGVGQCDFLVAVMDEASSGLGAEIVFALLKFKKPILMLAEVGATISALMVDLSTVFADHPVIFARYGNLDDMLGAVDAFVDAISSSSVW